MFIFLECPLFQPPLKRIDPEGLTDLARLVTVLHEEGVLISDKLEFPVNSLEQILVAGESWCPPWLKS